MDEIKIGGAAQQLPMVKPEKNSQEGDFGSVMKDALGKVTEIQKEAEEAVQQLSSGGDVTQAILAMEKADMSFQLMVEVRNKLMTAYEEVMRMQV